MSYNGRNRVNIPVNRRLKYVYKYLQNYKENMRKSEE